MWGWEDSACDLCGAPYCLCDCLEQLKEINRNVRWTRDLLVEDLRRARSAAGIRKDYVSPDFLAALRNAGSRRSLLRALASEIPEVIVHESWMMGEITSEESDEIQRLREEENAPWYAKWWRGLWEKD